MFVCLFCFKFEDIGTDAADVEAGTGRGKTEEIGYSWRDQVMLAIA